MTKKKISFLQKEVDVYSQSGRVKSGLVTDETDRFIVLDKSSYINRMAVWYIYVKPEDS